MFGTYVKISFIEIAHQVIVNVEQLSNTDLHLISDFTSPDMSRLVRLASFYSAAILSKVKFLKVYKSLSAHCSTWSLARQAHLKRLCTMQMPFEDTDGIKFEISSSDNRLNEC